MQQLKFQEKIWIVESIHPWQCSLGGFIKVDISMFYIFVNIFLLLFMNVSLSTVVLNSRD